MPFTFAEGLIDEVIDYLDANLTAKMDDINSQLNDGIELSPILEYVKREPGEPRGLTVIPSVFVVVPLTEITNWKQTSAAQRHELWIWLVTRDNDIESLRKLLYRNARALWETIVDWQFDTATWKLAGEVRPRFDFSETLTRGSSAQADVKLELAFEKLEME